MNSSNNPFSHSNLVTVRQVQLDFKAEFFFTASLFGWPLYSAPPLKVTTRLTTETAKRRQLGGEGSRMDANGYARQADGPPRSC